MRKELPNLPPLDERQRYSVDEIAAYLRISRMRVYQKISAGELTIFKDGRRTYAAGSEIARLSRPPQP